MKKLITFLVDEDDELKVLALIDVVKANTPLWTAEVLSNEQLQKLAEERDAAEFIGVNIGFAFHRALKAKEEG